MYGVFLFAAVVGGEMEGAPSHDFAKLDALVGTWETNVADDDGKKFRIIACWEPVLDGRFIEHRFARLDSQGQPDRLGLMMIGQDPTSGKMRLWRFPGFRTSTLVDGGQKQLVWRSDDGQASMQYLLVDEFTLQWSSSDGKELSFSKSAVEGKDLLPNRLAKVPAGVDEKMKELAWWAGNFMMRGNDALTGKAVVGRSKCGWVLAGKCLLYDNATVDADLTVGWYRAVIGVDSQTSKVTGWEFDSGGGVGQYTVSDKGQNIEGEAIWPSVGAFKYRGKMVQTDEGLDYQARGELPSGEVCPYHWIWEEGQD